MAGPKGNSDFARQTVELGRDELERLLDESRQSFSSETTGTLPRAEIDKLIEQGRAEMITSPSIDSTPQPLPPLTPIPPPPPPPRPGLPRAKSAPPSRPPARPPLRVDAAPSSQPPSSQPPSSQPPLSTPSVRPSEASAPPVSVHAEAPFTTPSPVEVRQPAPWNTATVRADMPRAAGISDADIRLAEGESKKRRAVRASIAVVLGALGVALVVAIASSESTPEIDTTTAASVAAPPIATPPPAPSPKPVAPAAVSAAETEARATLEQFRQGLTECVRKVVFILPGTAPAVPSSPALLKGPGYTPTQGDLKSPVWSCAKLKLDGAMHFIVQWQAKKPGTEGQAIAWIDADGDGKIDKTIGFSATLRSRGEMEATQIFSMEGVEQLPTY